MNAPVTPNLMVMALGALTVSDSPVQAIRRLRFTEASLKELAASMAGDTGILEPLVVRPLEQGYQIIAGERRYLAAKIAGLTHAPVIVRHLDDAEALRIQMIENLQRDDFHPLEEGAGFRELMRLTGVGATEVGAELGKSRSYVYARTKLLDLIPEGQAALQAGQIDASKALLLARFKSAKLQKKALEKLLQSPYWSYRRIVEDLRDKFMQRLDRAPFALDDSRLNAPGELSPKEIRTAQPMAMACTECPHNSANDAELAADLEGAHVCTHVPCYEVKVVRFQASIIDTARKEGRTILTGDDARRAVPGRHDSGYNAEFVDLDAQCEDMEFPEPEPKDRESAEWEAWDDRASAWAPPTFRALLGADKPESIVAVIDGKSISELVPLKAAAKILKAQGIKLDPPRRDDREEEAEAPVDPEERKRQQEKEAQRVAIEREYRKRLYAAVVAKWKGPFKRAEMRMMLEEVGVNDEIVELAYPNGTPNLEKAPEIEVMRFLFAALLADWNVTHSHGKPSELLDWAGRLKVDAKKIRAAVTAELSGKAAPAKASGKVRTK